VTSAPVPAPVLAAEAANGESGIGSVVELQKSQELSRRNLSDKASSYDSVRESIDEASGFVRGLWVTFVSLGAYLLIAAASVTHAQLFLETPIKLPLLDVNLPLVAFFWAAPFFFITFHFYLLLQLVVLAEKVRRLNDVIAEADLSKDLRHNLRLLLPNDLMVQFLAGPRKRREGSMGLMFRFVVWITVVVGPLGLLLLIQYKFLPYQNQFVTWTNRGLVLVDLALLWILWPKVITGVDQQTGKGWKASWSNIAGNVVGTLFVVALSLVALTFPGERLDNFGPQQLFHSLFAWQFPAPPLDSRGTTEDANWFTRTLKASMPIFSLRDLDGHESWLKSVPEARRLIPGNLRLQQAELIDVDKLKKIEGRTVAPGTKPWEGERTEVFIDRRFVAADLYRADLRRMDLYNSVFDRANLIGANLDGVTMKHSSLREALLDSAQLSGALLDNSVLLSASLVATNLQRASLNFADLRNAWMTGVTLQGAGLNQAWLQGANLSDAFLQGAHLFRALLRGASLTRAFMEGARFDQAELQGASLDHANLQGAAFDNAALEGSDLRGTNLEGALLDNARLNGAWIEGAQFRGASLVGTYVFRTYGDAHLESARLVRENLQAVFPTVGLSLNIQEGLVDGLTKLATSEVSNEEQRKAISERLSRLKPSAIDQAGDAAVTVYWSTHEATSVDIDAYQRLLGEYLTVLACRKGSAPYVARTLLQGAVSEPWGRAGAAGPYTHLFAEALRSGRTNITACPGTAGFVQDDWDRLERLVNDAPKPNATVITESVCSGVAAPFVARGFTNNGVLASVGDKLPAIAAKMRAARSRIDICPGVKNFTEEDWKELAKIAPEQAASSKP
jgi:uncharacterized protein YjbI with pentapeptide repeats